MAPLLFSLGVLVLAQGYSPSAPNMDVPDWWHSAKNQNGTHCCGANDYVPETEGQVLIQDGKYFVLYRGYTLAVPKTAIMPSPDFQFHFSIRNKEDHPSILCFFEPRSA